MTTIDMSGKKPAAAKRPVIADANRPFRLYHAQQKRFFRWRYYTDKARAMRSALWIAKWLAISETVEVTDVRNGKLHGSYTRKVNAIEFLAETNKVIPKHIDTLETKDRT